MVQTFKTKVVMHLSDKYQQTAADKLISNLRTELAAANEYIAELEEGHSPKIKALEDTIIMLRKEIKALHEQINPVSLEFNKEARVAKLLEDRKALKEENKKLIDIRDHLLYLLNKREED